MINCFSRISRMDQSKLNPCIDEIPLSSDQTNHKHKTERKKRKEAKKRLLRDEKEEKKMKIKIERRQVEIRFD